MRSSDVGHEGCLYGRAAGGPRRSMHACDVCNGCNVCNVSGVTTLDARCTTPRVHAVGPASHTPCTTHHAPLHLAPLHIRYTAHATTTPGRPHVLRRRAARRHAARAIGRLDLDRIGVATSPLRSGYDEGQSEAVASSSSPSSLPPPSSSCSSSSTLH